MSLRYCLLATEGPHDQAAISKLLQLSGLKEFNGEKRDLDPFWEGFVPNYPKAGNLYKRMDMPTILTSQTHSVAIYWGEGNNLVPNLNAIITNRKHYAEEIHSFGLIVDADKKLPLEIAKQKAKELQASFPMLSNVPGLISDGSPRTGIYILPNNEQRGTLDSLLVDCAATVYPEHKVGATHFLDTLLNTLDAVHTKKLRKDFAKEKAVVASIVSALRPGASNTSSIAQDQWINAQTVNSIKDVKLLSCFIAALLQLPEIIPMSANNQPA